MILAALAHAAPICAPVTLAPRAVQVGIESHGRTLGGEAILFAEDGVFSLTLLGPGGVEMFTADGVGVTTPIDSWRPFLQVLPVQRDLALLFTQWEGEACWTGTAVMKLKNGERRWRGEGGPARATVLGNRWTLVDRRRAYTLKLVVPDAT